MWVPRDTVNLFPGERSLERRGESVCLCVTWGEREHQSWTFLWLQIIPGSTFQSMNCTGPSTGMSLALTAIIGILWEILTKSNNGLKKPLRILKLEAASQTRCAWFSLTGFWNYDKTVSILKNQANESSDPFIKYFHCFIDSTIFRKEATTINCIILGKTPKIRALVYSFIIWG